VLEDLPAIGGKVALPALTNAMLAKRCRNRRRQRQPAPRALGFRLAQVPLASGTNQVPTDAECPGPEVDVVPGQRQRLTLTEPQRQHDYVERMEPVALGRLQEPGRLLGVEDRVLPLPDRWELDHGGLGDVASHQTLSQRRAQDRLEMVHGLNRKPAAMLCKEESLDLGRGQLLDVTDQPKPATRDQVKTGH
jgi:hypothetical protein